MSPLIRTFERSEYEIAFSPERFCCSHINLVPREYVCIYTVFYSIFYLPLVAPNEIQYDMHSFFCLFFFFCLISHEILHQFSKFFACCALNVIRTCVSNIHIALVCIQLKWFNLPMCIFVMNIACFWSHQQIYHMTWFSTIPSVDSCLFFSIIIDTCGWHHCNFIRSAELLTMNKHIASVCVYTVLILFYNFVF